MRTYSGVITGTDLLESIREYPDLPEFDSAFDELMDFREAAEVAAPIDDIYKCAVTPAPFSHDSKRIIVAPQELIYGLARMYQILSEDLHPNIYVVRSFDEAIEILNRPL